jgi:hypothetical protein
LKSRNDVYSAIMSPSDSEQNKRTKLELDYTREAAGKKIKGLENEIEELQEETDKLKKEVIFFARLAFRKEN